MNTSRAATTALALIHVMVAPVGRIDLDHSLRGLNDEYLVGDVLLCHMNRSAVTSTIVTSVKPAPSAWTM
jgi:hypothetical protein